MRKNRGAFFENNGSMAGFNPGPMGFQANNYSSFYSGPNPMMNNMAGGQDIEERLAKMERSIQRLDARISKLEGLNVKSTDDFESSTNNMYML